MQVIPTVVSQHAEEAAFLWLLREAAVAAPHYDLQELAELDNRVEAHLEGLRLAGAEGWGILKEELAWNEPGEVFAASIIAFESNDHARIAHVLEVATAEPELSRGVVSALGWMTYQRAGPHAQKLLASNNPTHKRVGLAALAIHRQDPGPALQEALRHDDPLLRMRGLKAVGELGRMDLLRSALGKLSQEDETERFWAAWSAALLGETRALSALRTIADAGGSHSERAAELVARRTPCDEMLRWQRTLAQDEGTLRLAATVAGGCGDPRFVPWLIEMMGHDDVARPAGEAFEMITGVDLAAENLERDMPEGFASGPTDDPADDDVELDADEDLPWPDQQQVTDWWNKNGSRFDAGTRYLIGNPISTASLYETLAIGRQRQRAAAARQRRLLRPGRPLFEVRAPGFRQERMLQR